MPVSNHLSRALFCCGALAIGAAHGAEPSPSLWTEEEAAAFCSALPVVNDAQFIEIVGEYAVVLKSLAPDMLSNARLLDYSAADSLLQNAIANNWGMMNALTDTHFQQNGACTLVMNAETLQQVDKSYNLHGLWMINAPLGDDGILPMRYILFGAGKVAIGYPDAAVIKVSDYDLAGGKYAYTRFMIADLVSSADMKAIQNIQVLNAPDEKPGRFRGPKGSSLLLLQLNGDNIDIRYSVLGIPAGETVDNLEIEKR